MSVSSTSLLPRPSFMKNTSAPSFVMTFIQPIPCHERLTLVFQNSLTALPRIATTTTQPRRAKGHPNLAIMSSKEATNSISVCSGPSCTKEGSRGTYMKLNTLTIGTEYTVTQCHCLGECGNGPNVMMRNRSGRILIKQVDNVIKDFMNLGFISIPKENSQFVKAVTMKEHADENFLRGRYERADEQYDEILQITLTMEHDENERIKEFCTSVLCNRSKTNMNLNKWDVALQCANMTVDLDPRKDIAWKRKAEAHDGLNESEHAINAWKLWGKLTTKHQEAERHIKEIEFKEKRTKPNKGISFGIRSLL